MGRFRFHRTVQACLLLLLAPLTAVASEPADSDTLALHFSAALEAARQNQWQQLDALEAELPDAFVLQDYLDFHRLRANLNNIPVDEVLAYLRRFDQSPLSDSMRRVALQHYGEQQNWSALRAVSAGVPGSLALRCYYFQAMLEHEPERALREASTLWLSGQSRPPTCDPLFDAMADAGLKNDALIWQRMLLAYEANNPGLMRYLRSELNNTDWRNRADTLATLYQTPTRVRYLEAGPNHADIATAALLRLAEQQPQEARVVLPMLARRFDLDDSHRTRISDRIAWFSVIRDITENRQWLDSYMADHRDPRLLEQRIRRAIAEQDWSAVQRWIAQLDKDSLSNPRWQYWLARAHEQQQAPEVAEQHLRQAATGRSFWGFLAADKLGLPPALNVQAPPSVLAPLNERSDRTLERVALLLAIGEAGHAREEWLHLLRHLDDEQQQNTLATTAIERGWHHLAIETALHSGQHDFLDWRFPAARLEDFQHAEKQHGVDSWLLMAIARRESAFNPRAQSHAGAQGLMQLMPGTARDMARQAGLKLNDNDAVFDAGTNIELGSRYMANMLQRYAGNRVLALAAYNAGPHRVDRWLDDNPTPFDVFIESIPFYETREYVQAVLAYRVIFSRHQSEQPLVALLESREMSGVYTPMQLAANQTQTVKD
ncbi:MAG: lytic transglycosylase [Gammaproteobacteria bacterium HGW-Gammaproteobacteria-14]|nr:MAG: lytic transglycosylase [Gammaproteobacteria bacterium HGW-Gammaproteobacteria-14]